MKFLKTSFEQQQYVVQQQPFNKGCYDDDDDDVDDNSTIIHTQTERLVANQLMKLSQQDRERVFEDIHGINNNNEEEVGVDNGSTSEKDTSSFVTTKLQELQKEIMVLPCKDKIAYEMARKINSKYVDDPKFCLQFLRADQFDTKKAAIRLVKHYQIKLELFGKDCLVRDITQQDLDDNDCYGAANSSNNNNLAKLYSGYAQFLPQMDKAGRGVFFLHAGHKNHICTSDKDIQNKLRRIFYLLYSHIQHDIQSQRNGLAAIIYAFGQSTEPMAFDCAQLSQALPLRFAVIHICYSSEKWKSMIGMFQQSLDLTTCVRVQGHYGTNIVDCLKGLSRFGIPTTHIPIDPKTGQLHIDSSRQHDRYLIRLRRLEAEEQQQQQHAEQQVIPASIMTVSDDDNNDNDDTCKIEGATNVSTTTTKFTAVVNTTIIAKLGPMDVIFGRGKKYTQNLGNIRLRKMMLCLKDKYDSATKQQKKNFAEEIVDFVRESGGKFLKEKSITTTTTKDDDFSDDNASNSNKSGSVGWKEVNNVEAREKISYTFRNMRKDTKR